MPNVFVPEERWAPRSWGVNHPLIVRAAARTRARGAEVRLLGLLAVQPTRRGLPGVRRRRLGLNPKGTTRTRRRPTSTAASSAAAAGTNPKPTYGDGVVTPHAAFLAMTSSQGDVRKPGQAPAEFGATGRAASSTRSPSGRHRGQALPLPGPGDDHGRPRQRARKLLLRRAFSTPDVEKVLLKVIGIWRSSAPGSSPSEPTPPTNDACCPLGPAARVVGRRPTATVTHISRVVDRPPWVLESSGGLRAVIVDCGAPASLGTDQVDGVQHAASAFAPARA